MNKKAKRVALFSALSAKVAAGELIVVDEIKLETYKTSAIAAMLKALGCQKEVTKNYKVTTVQDGEVIKERKTRTAVVAEKALVVLPEVNECVIKSCANLEGVKTTQWNTVNVYDILNCDTLVVDKAAVAKIEEVYAR